MPAPTDLALIVERALTEAERTAFLQRFNIYHRPLTSGNRVSYALTVLHANNDDLDVVDPILNMYTKDTSRPELIAHCTRAVRYIEGGPSWPKVKPLIDRCISYCAGFEDAERTIPTPEPAP